MTFDKLHAQIVEDLEVLGFDNLVKDMHTLKTLRPIAKKAVKRKILIKEQPLKVEITEAGKTTEVIFQTEKECETFLKLKQKQRLKTAKEPIGLRLPFFANYGGDYAAKLEKYKQDCTEYWQAAKDQNLDFTVRITRC